MAVKTRAIRVSSLGRTRDFDNLQSVIQDMHNRTAISLRIMLEDIHRIAEPNTPYRENGLRTSVSKRYTGHDKAFIEWAVRYAEVQEKGYRYDPGSGKTIYFRHYTTPGTGPHYAEDAVNSVLDRVNEYFLAGGVI